MQWNDYEPIEIERCLDCGYELELCDPFDVMTLEDMGINSDADLEMYVFKERLNHSDTVKRKCVRCGSANLLIFQVRRVRP